MIEDEDRTGPADGPDEPADGLASDGAEADGAEAVGADAVGPAVEMFDAGTRRLIELRAFLNDFVPNYSRVREESTDGPMTYVPKAVQKELALALIESARAIGRIARGTAEEAR